MCAVTLCMCVSMLLACTGPVGDPQLLRRLCGRNGPGPRVLVQDSWCGRAGRRYCRHVAKAFATARQLIYNPLGCSSVLVYTFIHVCTRRPPLLLLFFLALFLNHLVFCLLCDVLALHGGDIVVLDTSGNVRYIPADEIPKSHNSYYNTTCNTRYLYKFPEGSGFTGLSTGFRSDVSGVECVMCAWVVGFFVVKQHGSACRFKLSKSALMPSQYCGSCCSAMLQQLLATTGDGHLFPLLIKPDNSTTEKAWQVAPLPDNSDEPSVSFSCWYSTSPNTVADYEVGRINNTGGTDVTPGPDGAYYRWCSKVGWLTTNWLQCSVSRVG